MAQKSRSTRAAEYVVLAVALTLFGFSVWTSPRVVTQVPQMVGSAIVGVSAAVTPNADNILAAQLAAKEAELQEREAALSMRTQSVADDTRALYSFVASIILFGLLALNFYFDWRRGVRISRAAVQ